MIDPKIRDGLRNELRELDDKSLGELILVAAELLNERQAAGPVTTLSTMDRQHCVLYAAPEMAERFIDLFADVRRKCGGVRREL